MKQTLKWVGAGIPLLAVGYFILLCFPQLLFAYKVSTESITLYCDEPIPPSAALVLRDVENRLDKSPLYSSRLHQNAFVCNQYWRYKLLANRTARSGGVANFLCPWNVYLRKSDIAGNVLFRGDGITPSGPDRPLAYFIAHEITHNLTSRFTGPLSFWRMPAWKQEGYADYVGKGGDFDFEKNLKLFKANDPALNPSASGLYLRYQLMVAFLLERKKLPVEEMLAENFDRDKLEEEIRSLPDKVR